MKVWGSNPVDIITSFFFIFGSYLVLKEAWYIYFTLFLYLSIYVPCVFILFFVLVPYFHKL
jgi:hypothetical protein